MAYRAEGVSWHCTRRSRCAVTKESQTARRDPLRSIDTTVGRLIFNERIPQDLGFVDRSDPDNDSLSWKSTLPGRQEAARQDHRHAAIRVHGYRKTAEVLDRIKAHGLQVLHQAARSPLPSADVIVPPKKKPS